MRQEFPHLRDWCDEHLWAPGCYHGSVGQGWEVVEKYISTQNYRTVLKVRKLYRQKTIASPVP
ncbi:MAG: hypothetical protein KJ714_01605 [Euryarchaeota archaeon]|nr:hypothetical protein [Euryarchaeota archaeon]